MKLLYECYPEGIGEIIYFITSSSFVGVLEVSTNVRTGISNAIFRIGFATRGVVPEEDIPTKFEDISIVFSNQKIITELKKGDVCLIIELFGNLFTKLNDREAEQKIVELVFFSNFYTIIHILSSKKLFSEEVKEIIIKLQKREVLTEIKKIEKEIETIKKK